MYQIFAGKDMFDLWNANINHLSNPSEVTKKELEDLQKKQKEKLQLTQLLKENKFIKEFGLYLFDFVKSLPNKEYFLISAPDPTYLKWTIKDESVEGSDDFTDEYFVCFYKGLFDYKVSLSNGYDGTQVIEENISQERVTELLKNIK